MATLTITIPNASLSRILAAFSTRFGYQATLPDGTPNPTTLQEFTRGKLIAYIRDTVKEEEKAASVRSTLATIETDINNITIT